MERNNPNSPRQRVRELMGKERALVDLPSKGDIKVVLCYPNRYWLAMSNLGFQTVYKLLAQHPRIRVERAYIPEDEESSIRTFESNSPLSDADIVAVSVSFETDYLYVLRQLEACGLSLSSPQDSGPRPFLLGGGAALTLNPEPLAEFFDAIAIGEAEELIGEFIEQFATFKDRSEDFTKLLESLSRIEGMYIPSFYETTYCGDDTVKEISTRAEYKALDVALPVKRRYLKDINKFPTYTAIQTPETEFKSMFMTETGRGCEVGCKFCVAGYMYRPTRKRSAEVLAESVRIGVENSESVGFVGAAVSSHPKIAELASSVARAGKRAALSSIMSQRVTPELAGSLSESEYKTVALAPEAGSEALRFRIGKRVCDDQIEHAVATLAESGIRSFKLYFIVGLPSEEQRDVEAIPELVARLQVAALYAARKQSNFKITPKLLLSVNPFIPKAFTPFQRHGFMQFKEVKRRIELVERAVSRIPNVQMKFESPRESYFQALVSRGDRRVGKLLVAMLERGEDWRWLVRNGSERILEDVPPADFYVHRMIGKEERLPWEVVDLLTKREILERLYEETFTIDPSQFIQRKREEFRLESGAKIVQEVIEGVCS